MNREFVEADYQDIENQILQYKRMAEIGIHESRQIKRYIVDILRDTLFLCRGEFSYEQILSFIGHYNEKIANLNKLTLKHNMGMLNRRLILANKRQQFMELKRKLQSYLASRELDKDYKLYEDYFQYLFEDNFLPDDRQRKIIREEVIRCMEEVPLGELENDIFITSLYSIADLLSGIHINKNMINIILLNENECNEYHLYVRNHLHSIVYELSQIFDKFANK